MMYGFSGYEPRPMAAPRARPSSGHPLGQDATAATGGGKNMTWVVWFGGLLFVAGYVMYRQEQKN